MALLQFKRDWELHQYFVVKAVARLIVVWCEHCRHITDALPVQRVMALAHVTRSTPAIHRHASHWLNSVNCGVLGLGLGDSLLLDQMSATFIYLWTSVTSGVQDSFGLLC